MFPAINYKRLIISTLFVGVVCFLCFLFLLFTAHGSFDRGTLGHFITWFASGILHLLAIPGVFLLEMMKGTTSKLILFVTFGVDCILYGFLIERIITLLRSK